MNVFIGNDKPDEFQDEIINEDINEDGQE